MNPIIIFESDFQNTTISNEHLSPSKWNMPADKVSDFYLNNIGSTAYAYHQIIPSGDGTRNAMKAVLINDDPNVGGTTRAQATCEFVSTLDLPVYHTSHRMFIHPDMAFITQYPNGIAPLRVPDWLTVMEFWNQHNSAWDGDVAGSARWTLSICKQTGVGSPLYWGFTAEYMQPKTLSYKTIWPEQYVNATVPIGKWFTLEVYVKRGEGLNGQLMVSITPDDTKIKRIIFNVNNTMIYPGHPELKLSSWQAMKLYASPAVMTFMQQNAKEMSIMYNDYRWFAS